MTNIKKIQNLKEEFFEKKKKLKLQSQDALAVNIKFDYLLNTDVNWIVGEIRSAIMEEIEKLPDVQREKEQLILTFSIDQVSTEHSIEIVLTPGIISEIIEWARGIGIGIATYLILRGFERLREKQISKGMRPNIRHLEIKKVTIHPDGRVEYSEREEDTITIND